MRMNKDELASLGRKIRIAIKAGQQAAEACPNDSGSANLDRVVIPMPGVREAAVISSGLPGYLSKASTYHSSGLHLGAPFGGQGDRRYAGVQAMHRSLQEQGVDCYVYYQID
ncbi:hypothetical protein ALP72_102034 [Pseudomonas coronafaciens pv. coronafaciens]|uniref:Uncharacterized protein n=3 Tax=Pseudomonas syringae group TaxID=136849 RepID=A0AB37QI24_9PSED|nr:hypothetical protein ALQ71_101935 [Pseudomonas coronafaciens pv. striafaciens]RMR95302.1 hypothetical protein ALP74_101918 [Pseudomonas coronafaciens pv. garcae]RMS14503.1 hypothetical protein ALP72_102034 [Pseudomonas coronafaciens pv. coronafaciens]